jgi:hypothetical protein
MERSLHSNSRSSQVDEAQCAQRISVATDFSDAPGARYRTDGPKSAEEFYEELLRPRFLAAKQAHAVLLVDLDGTWGYASSFISGAFGRLARDFGRQDVEKHLALKFDEDALLLEKINEEIRSEGKD